MNEPEIPKIVCKSIAEMNSLSAEARAAGKSIGLTPTMGALHEGHLSLIERSAAENDLTVVSIFVNPIQFDDLNDFSNYPETLATDTEKAFAAGADILFIPDAAEMYPDGFSTYIDMTGITEKLCGAARPSHFRGVLTVVGKLFGICMPTQAYFGEKDAQQLAAVSKMVRELCMNVKIIPCPTVRDPDGLAISSRNVRLTNIERAAASCLFLAMDDAKKRFLAGTTDSRSLLHFARAIIEAEKLARIDYISIVDPLTFDPVPQARHGDLIILAVYFGNTRLIDNMTL